MRKWFLVKEKSQCYNEGNGKRKNSFQQSANNDREATLEQFFQRNILLQNKISYQEALDEVVEIFSGRNFQAPRYIYITRRRGRCPCHFEFRNLNTRSDDYD